jgi:phosphopantothenoylcysteine decarboxylase/phosphopantothenate--cysteine ligase
MKKKILLIITGGIAAYKSLELIRELREENCDVTCILTKAGSEFVTPLSIESLSENKVYTDLFNLTDEHQMGHIQLSRMADAILIAPATANIISKMTHGISDDLASTVLKATNKPVLIAPAMNVQMWINASTQRNIEVLKNDGINFIGPEIGSMACGEYGEGRLSETSTIVRETLDFIYAYYSKPLKDLSAIVTAGPTQEMIDPIRFISNESSGKQGYAIADRLSQLGAKTTLVSGPTHLDPPANCNLIKVRSANDMLNVCENSLPSDIVVCAAAVGDFKVEKFNNEKIKKSGNTLNLELNENVDILKSIGTRNSKRPKLVIGFAAETNNLIENATKKLNSKGSDWIIANDVSNGKVIGKNHNEICLISNRGVENWPEMTKSDVAKKLSQRIVDHFSL